MNINNSGYTRGTSTSKNKHNFIPSSKITMKNVDIPLVLIPMVNGKLQHSKKVIAKPGDDDIDFGPNVQGVMEIPYGQNGINGLMGYIGPYSNPEQELMGNGMPFSPTGGLGNPIVQGNQTSPSNSGFNENVYYNSGMKIYDPKRSRYISTPIINPDTQSVGENNVVTNTPANASALDGTPIVGKNGPMPWESGYAEYQKSLGVDPNKAQQKEADKTKKRTDLRYVGGINPYGGWNMENSSVALGAFLQNKNYLGAGLAAGKVLLSGMRNAFGGSAAMKQFKDSQKEYQERLREYYNKTGLTHLQKGGTITKEDALMMTGNALKGNDNHPSPTAEVEKGEYVQTPDGDVMEVLGKKHSKGGELISPPDGTDVVSDYLRIGGDLAKYFKKTFNINVTPNSTFATVLDKYKKKIGLTELIEEEASILKKIASQEDVKYKPTREINLQILSKKVNELQGQKVPLEDKFEEFTKLIFDLQEEQKVEDVEKSKEYQEGGEVQEAPQEGIPTEAIIQEFANVQGLDPKDVIKQLESMGPDEQQAAIQKMYESLESGGSQQEGGSPDVEQVVRAFAEIAGENPEEILEQLSQMDEAQVKQIVSEMLQVVQQSQNQQSLGQPQEFQDGGSIGEDELGDIVDQYTSITGDDYDDVMGRLSEMEEDDLSDAIHQMLTVIDSDEGDETSDEEDEDSEEDEEDSDYFGELRRGGKIRVKRFQKGGRYRLKKTGLANWKNQSIDEFLKDYTFGPGSIQEWYDSQMERPDYTYDNLEGIKKRGLMLAEQRGLDVDEKTLKTREDLNKLFGRIQQYDKENRNVLANDYSRNVWATRKGLTELRKHDSFMNKLKELSPETYNKFIKNFDKKGNALRGSYDIFNDDEHSFIEQSIDNLDDKQKESFVGKNYFDNEAFFRGINAETFVFKDKKEYEDYLEKNKDRVIRDEKGIPYIRTGKRGIYETPILLQDKHFKTAEERDAYVKDKELYNDTFFLENGIYYNPIVGEPEKKEEPKNPDPLDNLNELDRNRAAAWADGPLMVPDQSNIPPIYIPTSMRELKHVQSDRVFLSPEENLKELHRQTKVAGDLMAHTNPYSSGAMLSNLKAQQDDASNKAITQMTIANQQDERRVNDMNEARIQERDVHNTNFADKYEKEVVLGRDNYHTSWMNYIDNKNRINVENWNLQNQHNALNAITDNFKVDGSGRIVQTGDQEQFYLHNNKYYNASGKELSDEEIKLAKALNDKKKAEEKLLLAKGLPTKLKKGGIFNLKLRSLR